MTQHPTYPLQHEQRAEIIMDGKTTEDVERIQKHFAIRRDSEFPGWQDWYEKEIATWLESQRYPRRERS